MLYPFIQLRRGLFENGGSKGVIEIPIAAARENIEINDLQFVGLRQATRLLHKRSLPPATWRNQHRVHTMPEIQQQSIRFLLTVGKIFARCRNSESERFILHDIQNYSNAEIRNDIITNNIITNKTIINIVLLIRGVVILLYNSGNMLFPQQ